MVIPSEVYIIINKAVIDLSVIIYISAKARKNGLWGTRTLDNLVVTQVLSQLS